MRGVTLIIVGFGIVGAGFFTDLMPLKEWQQ